MADEQRPASNGSGHDAGVGRPIRGGDLGELAVAGTACSRSLRAVASYLHELGPDDRARVLAGVAALLERRMQVDRLYIAWCRLKP